MQDLAPVIVRIILRYLSGALMAYGGTVAATGIALLGHPQVEAGATAAVGAVLAYLTERLYAAARRDGGPT